MFYVYLPNNFIKTKFDASLLFTDKDSLTYEIKFEDVYKELFKDKYLFDFSEYQQNFFHPTNKKITGKMKDKFKGNLINKFIGLKSKMYDIVAEGGEEFSKAKRINTSIKMFCLTKK